MVGSGEGSHNAGLAIPQLGPLLEGDSRRRRQGVCALVLGAWGSGALLTICINPPLRNIGSQKMENPLLLLVILTSNEL